MVNQSKTLVFLLILCVVLLPVSNSLRHLSTSCLAQCNCNYTVEDGVKVLTKLICTNSYLENNFLYNLPHQIDLLQLTALNVSHNDITDLKSLTFPSLRKLDLSWNKIHFIHPTAFQNLTYLVNLDLSSNRIKVLVSEAFRPLKQLQKFKLKGNFLSRLGLWFFNVLPSLKSLDISENPWHCDCSLSWLSEWIRNTTVKVLPPPKCNMPDALKNETLKKLKLKCAGSQEHFSLLAPEVEPAHNQIVFEGDSLELKCRSLSLNGYTQDEQVFWTWNEQDPRQHFEQVSIEEHSLAQHGIAESFLRIDKLQPSHSGEWVCQLISQSGNHSSSVSVIVLSDHTRYCSETVTKNNKGVYYWPKTVVGYTLDFPCEIERQPDEVFAHHTCAPDGTWVNLNTSACPYVSNTTAILEQFFKDNATVDGIFEKATRLRNLTIDPKTPLTDIMDVTLLANTIQKYTQQVDKYPEILPLLLEMVENLLRLPQSLLRSAQQLHHACSIVIGSCEQMAQRIATLQVLSRMLAVEKFKVNPGTFSGLACSWMHHGRIYKEFQCIRGNDSEAGVFGRVEAKIFVPASVFWGVLRTEGVPYVERQLVITMFENGRLFPDLGLGGDYVVAPVVGANLMGLQVSNLTEPVLITLRVPIESPMASPKPVWWHLDLNNGSGGWSTEGCQIKYLLRDSVVFHCDRLGYFGLLEDMRLLKNPYELYLLNSERLRHPALYTGSFILISCFAIMIVTYVTFHTSIQMARRAKHSIVNTWISISFLCLVFSFGINQTEDRRRCEAIGLVLHYFTLSTLLWMCVTVHNMYKRISKNSRLSRNSEDELPPGVPVHKPIMGIYLVGWGVGLIVCGISGAVNLREYAQPKFCFLATVPALTALYVPTAMLLTHLAIFHFLTRCAIRSDVTAQLSDGTQATEHVDIELLDVTQPTTHRSVHTPTLTHDSEEVDDPEHAARVQLNAHVVALGLYLVLWSMAALFVTETVSFLGHFLAGGYCLLAFCFAAFTLYFYGVARSDVRERWGVIRRLFVTGGRQCCRTRSVSDTQTMVPLQQTTSSTHPVAQNGAVVTAVALPALSSSSINSSSMTSNSRLKAGLHLNGSAHFSDETPFKTPTNVNLVALHRQMYRSNNSMPTYHEVNADAIEVFYNPRQSIVAKKFFRKQRRNQRNELGLRRRGDGGSNMAEDAAQTWRPSAESAVFLSSDMENTSEHLRKDEPNPVMDRLVIGAELEKSPTSLDCVEEELQSREKDEEEESYCPPDFRNVRLQCSLGEPSCSDLNTEDSHGECSTDDVECPEDCACAGQTSSLFSPMDSPLIGDEDSISRRHLTLDQEDSVSPEALPQFITLNDPKNGLATLNLAEFVKEQRTPAVSPTVVSESGSESRKKETSV